MTRRPPRSTLFPYTTLSRSERWRAARDASRARRERLAADLRQVLEDFQALRAEPSFPGLEDTLATLAARVRQGEEADDEQALARGLWSLSLPGGARRTPELSRRRHALRKRWTPSSPTWRTTRLASSRKRRWASASPSAKPSWWGSSSRRNRMGTSWAALRGSTSASTASPSRAAWWSRSWPRRA